MFHKRDQGTSPRTVAPGIEMETLCYGERTLMARFTLKRGSVLPLHTHPHEQTGMLLSGKVRFEIEGTRVEATPGDAWCIPGDTVHGVEVLEDSVIVEVFSPVREEYLPTHLEGSTHNSGED